MSYFRVETRGRSPADREQLDRELELLGRLMDNVFRIPGVGWRFGLDPVLGLIPGVGDLVGTMVSVYILLAAARYGVPKITLVRMGLNAGIDMVIGAIPFLGDLFDAYWKSNSRNLALLRQRVQASGRRRGDLSDWLFVGVVVALLLALLLGSIALVGWLLGQLFGLIRGI